MIKGMKKIIYNIVDNNIKARIESHEAVGDFLYPTYSLRMSIAEHVTVAIEAEITRCFGDDKLRKNSDPFDNGYIRGYNYRKKAFEIEQE